MKLRLLVLAFLSLLWASSAQAVVDGSCNFTASNGTADGFRGCKEELEARAPRIASVAALRALTTTTLPNTNTTVNVLSWNVGLRLGGGLFELDLADTTSPDDEGLVIVDASTRRWKRVTNGGAVFPTWFGGFCNGTTDDADPLQDAWNAAKASLTGGHYTKYVDLAGLECRTTVSLDFTGIVSGRNLGIRNGTIDGAVAGLPVIDATGSQFVTYQNLYIIGAGATPPTTGLLLARNAAAGPADSNILIDVFTAGDYSIASIVIYGSETNSFYGASLGNAAFNPNSAVLFVGGSPDEFTAAGLAIPTSAYQSLFAGTFTSTSGNTFSDSTFRRNRKTAMTVTAITKANPAVVTVDGTLLDTAIAAGFANGSQVHMDVLGMTEILGRVYTVANINTGTDTFELSGLNSTGFGTFTSGQANTKTGPAVIIGSSSRTNIHDTYMTSYGSPQVRFVSNGTASEVRDVRIGPARFEPANMYHFEFVGAATGAATPYTYQGVHLQVDNALAVEAPIKTTKGHNGNTFIIEGLRLNFNKQAQVPLAGLFETPGDVTLRQFDIRVPNANVHTDPTLYATGSSGDDCIAVPSGASQRCEHFGAARRFHDNPDFYTSGTGTVMEAISSDAGAVVGPLVGLVRDSASPAVNDTLARLRWIGNDSGAAAQEYSALDTLLLDPTAGSEDGQLRILTVVAGTQTATAKIGQGMQVGAPTGADPGVGSINVAGGYQINGVAAIIDGDRVRVEDGDNLGTYTSLTDVDFEDSADINFIGATGPAPNTISAVVRADSVALTTDTTGFYAAGDAEAGAALSGDTATAFFTAGTIEVSRGGTGAAPTVDDQVFVSSSASAGAWATLPDSEAAGTILGYDVTTNAFSTKADDDVPEVGDFGALVGGSGIDNNSGTLDFDATELSSLVWGAGAFTTVTFDTGAVDPVFTYSAAGAATYTTSDGSQPAFILGDQSDLRWREEAAGGTDSVIIRSPAALTGSRTCVFQDAAAPIPYTCVGTGATPGDVIGAASSTDNAIAVFNGTGGKTIKNSTVTISTAGQINHIAGTTTDAAMLLPAGTLNTTAQDGGIEVDANTMYAATDAGNRGYIPLNHLIRLDANYTLTSAGTEQKLFNSPTNGRLTLETGAYDFECKIAINTMSATSGNAAFDPIGAGTATGAAFLYSVNGSDAALITTVGAVSGSMNNTQQTAASMVTAGTGVALQADVEGTFEISVAGTIIPSVTLVTAAAAVAQLGSYCRFTRSGSTTLVSVGQWD